MKKKKVRAILLHAPEWCMGSRLIRPHFVEECKKHKMPYEMLDVEYDKNALALSIKHEIRNVPAILFFEGNTLVGTAKGNNSYQEIGKYSA